MREHGMEYHHTTQKSTVTHGLWISHNPEVAGSSPVSATISLWQKRCHRLFSLLYRRKSAVSTANFRVAFYKDVQRFSDCWTFLLPHLPAKFWIAAGERAIFLRKNRINPAVFRMFSKSPQPLNSTPFVRQYDILSNKWGVLLCQKEYQTNDIRRSSREWL